MKFLSEGSTVYKSHPKPTRATACSRGQVVLILLHPESLLAAIEAVGIIAI